MGQFGTLFTTTMHPYLFNPTDSLTVSANSSMWSRQSIPIKRLLCASLMLASFATVTQRYPGLAGEPPPIPNRFCEGTRFYRVQSPSPAGLVILLDNGDKRAIANGSLVMVEVVGARGTATVVTPYGTTGAIHEKYLRPVRFGKSQFSGKLRVKTLDSDGFVNVRQAPVYGSRVLGTLTNGTLVTPQKMVGEWIYVTSGQTRGYVANAFLICD